MNSQEVRYELSQYQNTKNRRLTLEKKIKEKQADIIRLKEIIGKGLTVKFSVISDDVECIIKSINGLIISYTEMLEKEQEQEKRTLSMIRLIEDSLVYQVIYLRFIEGEKILDIADALYIADRTVWHKIKNGVDEIAAKYTSSLNCTQR